MKTLLIAGLASICLGSAALAYQHFNYSTTENVLQIGSLKATVQEEHTVTVPPLVGWLLVVGGACALAFAALSKKN